MSNGGNPRAAFSFSTRRVRQIALALTLVTATVGGVFSGLAGGWPWVDEYARPEGSEPAGITRGPDGNLWFTEAVGNKIGRITPSGAVTAFPLDYAIGLNVRPVGITVGPDGALWFAMETNKIGRITTTGDISWYPTQPGQPHGITAGPDGALWFTYFSKKALGRMSLTGQQDDYPLTIYGVVVDHPVNAHSITTGPDGNLWFTEFQGDRIARYRIGARQPLTEFKLADFSRPHGIVTGPDGAMWFAATGGHKIGRLTTTMDNLQEFFVGRSAGPHEIAPDVDGNLWFTDIVLNRINRFNLATHVIDRFDIPTPASEPGYLVAGPDRAMWFHERAGDKIGRISIDPDTTH